MTRRKAQWWGAAWAALGIYNVVRGYEQGPHDASPFLPWLNGTRQALTGGMALLMALMAFRDARRLPSRAPTDQPREKLSRAERIGFKVLGVPLIVIGLGFLVLGALI